MTQQNAHDEDGRKVVDLLKDASVAMVTSIGTSGLQAHPMSVQKVDDQGNLWFLVDRTSEQARNIQSDPRVNVSVASTGSWVSAAGDGEILQERGLIEELWSPLSDAYFEGGKDDPDVAVLHVHTVSGEYWGAPGGKLTAVGHFLKAKVTGEKPEGHNAEARLD